MKSTASSGLSLQGRSLLWLAQREHSRLELERKLRKVARAQFARERAAVQNELADADVHNSADPSPALSPEAQVQATLVWLQERGYLSDVRFVESRVHVRAAKFGSLRIQQELAQHGLALTPQAAHQLKDSETQRAHAVWQKKFGVPAHTPQEHARQMRFLAGRGFHHEVIRRVLHADLENG
jgi:regulatory protein